MTAEEQVGRPVNLPLTDSVAWYDHPVLGHLLMALDTHLQTSVRRADAFEKALREAIAAGMALVHGDPGQAFPAQAALSQRTLNKVNQFIESHLGEDFSVDDIARAACLSPYHLGRAYHQTTGHSLWQHVLHRRAERAHALIAQKPDTPLSVLAGLCGFDTYGQFIAAFRKVYGTTPGAYRRSLRRSGGVES